MGPFLTEKLPETVDHVSNGLRLMARRFYLRRQLKKKFANHRAALTPDQRRQAKKYWSRYTRHFSPLWHELLTEKTGVFDVRYVPVDLQFTELEDRLNDWSCAHGIDNKNNYTMYFPEVRHPKSVFRKMRGIYHGDDYSIISEQEAIQNCIECGNVIFKVALESGKGSGIFFWRTEDGMQELLKLMQELPAEVNAQEYITQHADMARMNPSSCNTIRVVTYANQEGIRVLRSYFQVGRSDDARMGKAATGGVNVSIHPDGTLYPVAYDSSYNGHTEHPCGLKFEGYPVPSYDKVCESAILLHKKMGNFRLISWDFTVAENGDPVFIEMNIKYGGTLYHQLSSGPFFGEQSDEILDEIFERRKR